jgi:hypothetical protein
MTDKEIKKLFKREFGVLPLKEKDFIELKAAYKIKQSASNKELNLLNQEKSIRKNFEIYTQALRPIPSNSGLV